MILCRKEIFSETDTREAVSVPWHALHQMSLKLLLMNRCWQASFYNLLIQNFCLHLTSLALLSVRTCMCDLSLSILSFVWMMMCPSHSLSLLCGNVTNEATETIVFSRPDFCDNGSHVKENSPDLIAWKNPCIKNTSSHAAKQEVAQPEVFSHTGDKQLSDNKEAAVSGIKCTPARTIGYRRQQRCFHRPLIPRGSVGHCWTMCEN